jgi:hypothetical protein
MKPDNFMKRISEKISLNNLEGLVTILEIINTSIDRKEYAIADGGIHWIEEAIFDQRFKLNNFNKIETDKIYAFIEVMGMIKSISNKTSNLKDDYFFMWMRIKKLYNFFDEIKIKLDPEIENAINTHFKNVYQN